MTTDRNLKVNTEGLFTQRSNWMILIWVLVSTEGHHKILFKSCQLSPTENNFIITKGSVLSFTHCCTVCPKSLATTQGHNQVAFKDFSLGVRDCFCLGTSERYLLGHCAPSVESLPGVSCRQQIHLASSQEGISWLSKMEIDVFSWMCC